MTADRHRAEIRKQNIAESLEPVYEETKQFFRKVLNPYEVRHNVVDNGEMNELIAYQGFQERYPHYSWGQNYVKQEAMDKMAGGALEIVNNDEPANSFLMESNTMGEQKSVISHVEAHSDFFANNPSFFYDSGKEVNAAQMLAQNADKIEDYKKENGSKEVERIIDLYKCLEMNINPFRDIDDIEIEGKDYEDVDAEAEADELGFDTEEITEDMENFIEDYEEEEEMDERYTDLLNVLIQNGMVYNEEQEKSVEMEDWQTDTLDRLREESYYMRGQAKTKVMNEGWATYWQSLAMQDEGFSDKDEFMENSQLISKVLDGPPSANPYKLGLMLWNYAENSANRREVANRLVEVDGIDEENFHDLDFAHILDELEPDKLVDRTASFDLRELARMDDDRLDYESIGEMLRNDEDVSGSSWKPLNFKGLAERHFSLLKPENRGFIQNISKRDVEDFNRLSSDRYSTVDEALEDVDKAAGWKKMLDDRATKNDISFLDEHITQEFVNENEMWLGIDLGDAYLKATHDATPVKNKLLINRTNFGQPRVDAVDTNYDNRGDLMLEHRFNGLDMDISQATEVIKKMQPYWGKGVGIKVMKNNIDQEYLNGIREAFIDQTAHESFDEVIAELPEPEQQGFEILYRPDEEFINDSDVMKDLGADLNEHFRVKELDDEEIEAMEAEQDFDPIYSTLKM